jgi:hypothetical protein
MNRTSEKAEICRHLKNAMAAVWDDDDKALTIELSQVARLYGRLSQRNKFEMRLVNANFLLARF